MTKIKNKQIEAKNIGSFYVISKNNLSSTASGDLSEKLKRKIDQGVLKVIEEYGETLKLLGRE